MGPRQRGRGNDRTAASSSFRTTCFNGAASARTRKLGSGTVAYVAAKLASMGPRQRGRGNNLFAVHRPAGFSMLQWGRVSEDAETPLPFRPERRAARLQWGRVSEDAETSRSHLRPPRRPRRFNGAASARTRKPLTGRRTCGSILLASMGPRQRGRGNQIGVRHHDSAWTASMGPRQRGRGNPPYGLLPGEVVACFNGAASARTRKLFPAHLIAPECNVLQWGRVSEDAETN